MNKSKASIFESINPQECINAKLRKLHRLLNRSYQKKIAPFGLKGSMLSILFIIGKQKKINQKTIAEMLVLDQSTMSRDLKKLIEKEWVVAIKGDDLRHSELELTQKGYGLLEKVTPIWERLHKNVETVLGSYNIQQIDTLINAVKGNRHKIEE